jgi:hypothetical protein
MHFQPDQIKVYCLSFLTLSISLLHINQIAQFILLLVTIFYTIYKLKNEYLTYKKSKKNESN